MNERQLGREEIEVAWAGWPVPELIGGAVVGGLLGLSTVTVVPYLSTVFPNVAGLIAGAMSGALLSWIWRPRRLALRRERRVTPEQQHLRRAA